MSILRLVTCQAKVHFTYRSNSSEFFNSQTTPVAVNETRGGMGGEVDCSGGAEVESFESFNSRCARGRGSKGIRTGGQVSWA